MGQASPSTSSLPSSSSSLPSPWPPPHHHSAQVLQISDPPPNNPTHGPTPWTPTTALTWNPCVPSPTGGSRTSSLPQVPAWEASWGQPASALNDEPPTCCVWQASGSLGITQHSTLPHPLCPTAVSATHRAVRGILRHTVPGRVVPQHPDQCHSLRQYPRFAV